jgi:hypothetical protein
MIQNSNTILTKVVERPFEAEYVNNVSFYSPPFPNDVFTVMSLYITVIVWLEIHTQSLCKYRQLKHSYTQDIHMNRKVFEVEVL